MSVNNTCAISSSISFLISAAIWIYMEMPVARILSSRPGDVERDFLLNFPVLFGQLRSVRVATALRLVAGVFALLLPGHSPALQFTPRLSARGAHRTFPRFPTS